MKRLSDPATREFKSRQAVFLSLAVGAVIVWTYFAKTPHPSNATISLVVAIFAGIVVFVVRRQFWYVADEVLEDGSALVVRRGKAKVRVVLGDIVDIFAVNFNSSEAIAIRLRTPVPPFGAQIVFLPPAWQTSKGGPMDELAAALKIRLVGGNLV
jgi:hypothetical protein